MKKIINGKLYNTDTAKLVGSYEFSNRSDFRYYSEELYRKKTGEYFLAGEGGAMSKYRASVDANNWRGGEEITPMPLEEALAWAEQHMDADAYVAAFGEPPEDDSTVSTTVHLPSTLHALLKRKQSETGLPMNQIVADALEAFLCM